MKAILTYIAIFSFGILALAQEPKSELKMEALTGNDQIQSETKLKKRFPKKRNVARIYLFKNSRIKKELSFRVKKNKTKLA